MDRESTDKHAKCAALLDNFMNISLPELWKEKPDQILFIQGWNEDKETVAPFDRFARWESTMRHISPEIMIWTCRQLGFFRGIVPPVVSPSGTDWTFLVHVIRYMFLPLVSEDTKELFEERELSMKLLDDMEQELINTERSNTERSKTPPPHAERRGRDTPEPDKDPYSDHFWRRRPRFDAMLARLRDFIE
jgi:hypothetical protein